PFVNAEVVAAADVYCLEFRVAYLDLCAGYAYAGARATAGGCDGSKYVFCFNFVCYAVLHYCEDSVEGEVYGEWWELADGFVCHGVSPFREKEKSRPGQGAGITLVTEGCGSGGRTADAGYGAMPPGSAGRLLIGLPGISCFLSHSKAKH